jgi:Zn-dependent protease
VNGVPVARLLGVEGRIHPTWILIVALLAVVVVGLLEEAGGSLPPIAGWVAGVAVALAFLASAIAHELAHAVVARRRGLDPGPVTVFFFGGSASLEPEADDPEAEAAIALAGPIVSVSIGTVTLAGTALAELAGVFGSTGVGTLFLLLATLNLILGFLNLVPAYPLDGGRLARAVAWRRSGDARSGARAVVRSGRLIGWSLVGVALAVIVVADPLDGVMFALAGWFLASAAGQAERRVEVEALLDGVRVGDVLELGIASIAPQLTVDTFADQILAAGALPTLAVFRDDELVGIVAASRVRRLGRRSWSTTRALDVMVEPPELPLLRLDDTVWNALVEIRRTGLEGLPVVGDDGLLGVVTRRGVLSAIRRQQVERGGR